MFLYVISFLINFFRPTDMSMKRHTKSDKGEPFVRNCNGEMIAGPPSVVHGTYGGSFKFCDS